MTVVLLGGEHAHEHFNIDEEEVTGGPPQYIRVQTRDGGGPYGRSAQVSVYQHTGSQTSAGTEVYQFTYKKHGMLDGLVAIGNEY